MDCRDVAALKQNREQPYHSPPLSKKTKTQINPPSIPPLKELVHRFLSSLSFEALSTRLRHVPAPVYYNVLPNEFTVCFQHRKKVNSEQPMASIRLAVKTGFIAENLPEEANLSHFTEHALFLGTTSYSQEAIKEHFESLGCEIGSDANAYTIYENTVYELNHVPTHNKDLVLKCIHMMYEFACQATFPPDLVRNESKVVQQELLEAKQGPSGSRSKWRFRKWDAKSSISRALRRCACRGQGLCP